MSADHPCQRQLQQGVLKCLSRAGDRSGVHRIQPYGLYFFLECSKYTDFIILLFMLCECVCVCVTNTIIILFF